jgi:PGF-pre-PGF domain-containing protein
MQSTNSQGKESYKINQFVFLKNSGQITSTIEVLNNRSKLVNSTPDGSIYIYVNIWVGKAGFATASNIKVHM